MDPSHIPFGRYHMKGSASANLSAGNLLSRSRSSPTRRQLNHDALSKAEKSQYLFADSNVYNRLLSEPGVELISEKTKLVGYELYVVEQWACERSLNLSVTAYTGIPANAIFVGALSIPVDSSLWSEPIADYFEEISRMHLRPKETELGKIFVTNLSSFPSNLNLVPIPSGDMEQSMYGFMLNEGLRRTGCGGRALLSVNEPTDASEDKFRALFKIDEKVPISFAVVELITLVQLSLLYCGLLEPKYVDGLLCNFTTAAVSSWWDKWGQLVYHTRPKEAALGPVGVSGIIGFISATRARLSGVGAKPPKDPFDAVEFLQCLRNFQKHEGLQRPGKINTETYLRLLTMTDRNSNIELIGLVRSAMKEVSGKAVQTMSDAETLDLDKLISCVQGARARYLWKGKGDMRSSIDSGYRYCHYTGIPLSAVSSSTYYNEGINRAEFGKNMIRSVVPTRRHKRDSDGSAKAEQVSLASTRPASPVLTYTEMPEENSENHSSLKNNNSETALYSPELYNSSAQEFENPEKSDRFHFGRSSSRHDGHYLRSHRRKGRLHQKGHDLKEKYWYRRGSQHFLPEEGLPYEHGSSARPLNDPDGDSESSVDGVEPSAASCLTGCVASIDDLILDYVPIDRNYSTLRTRRSYSFSTVEEAVNRWQFDTITEKSVVHGLQQIAYHYRQIDDKQEAVEERLDDHRQTIAALDRQVKQESQVTSQAHYLLQNLTRKESVLHSQIGDLGAIGARLQYETRLLEGKLRDVEDAVDSLGRKVNTLDSRMAKIAETHDERRGYFISMIYTHIPMICQKILGFKKTIDEFIAS